MSKHYKCPCLLIEFDPEKTFELQSKHELGGDIKMDSICSKLVLVRTSDLCEKDVLFGLFSRLFPS